MTSDERHSRGWPMFLMSNRYGGNSEAKTTFGMDLFNTSNTIALAFDFDYNAGDILHIALTWDVNDPTHPVKVYHNGKLATPAIDRSVNPQQELQDIITYMNTGKSYDIELLRRSKRPDGAANQFDDYQFVDNLKVYDFAKTDFSDRDKE
jgi:hypothetical protein